MNLTTLATQTGTTPTGTASASLAQAPSNGLSDNYKSFLNLLVAQVSYQDPLNPVEGTDFIAQLATLTGVEQSLKMNDQLAALRAQMGLSAALSESSLIGRSVTVPSEEIELGAGGASFSYELGRPSASVSAIISDASGRPVRELSGLPGVAGERVKLSWDGTDAQGVALPPGRYKLALAATDTGGGYNTYASFKVVSISFAAGQQYLDLEGGGAVTSDQIIRID
jgi:flagellar basal-body rod modification protein FlgD